jgi:hypothetical protein
MNQTRFYPMIAVSAALLALVYVWQAEKSAALSNAAFRLSTCGHPMNEAEILRGVRYFHDKLGYSWGYSADSFGDLTCLGKAASPKTY